MKTRFTLFSFSLLFIFLITSGNIHSQAPAIALQGVIGSAGSDQGNAVAVDAAGNSYYTGTFQGTADFDPGPGTFNLISQAGSSDIYIFKLSPTGNLLWAKSIGGDGSDAAMDLAVDASGNVHVIGYFSSPTIDFDPGPGVYAANCAGNSDLYLLTLDASGNFMSAIVWASTRTEQGRAIAIDGEGNIFLTGSFSGSIDFDPGPGNTTLTSSGNPPNIFVLKLDASRNFLWARNFGGANSDVGMVLDVDASDNVIVAGSFTGTVDFDPGDGIFNLVAAGSELFLLKLDPSGNFVWAGKIGGNTTEFPNSLKTDASGNIYVGGNFGGTFDFDPGPGTHNVTSAGSDDGFLLKLDADGNLVYVYTFGSTGIDHVYGVAVDATGSVYVTGDFAGTVDFDPGAGTANLTSAGAGDLFLARFDASGNHLWSIRDGGAGGEAINKVTIDDSGNMYGIGRFSGTASLGGAEYTSVGGADIFVLKVNDAITLPLHLTSFNVHKENDRIRLEWATSNEDNVSHFNIERSLDGEHFISLAQVAARNQPSAEYRHTDPVTFNSTVYYRLKITDLDGGYAYSPVRSVKASAQDAVVQLGPVPSKNSLNINTTGIGDATGRISIQVFNRAGQLVKTGSMPAGAMYTLDVSALAAGHYFIRLTGAGNYQSTHPFVKE